MKKCLILFIILVIVSAAIIIFDEQIHSYTEWTTTKAPTCTEEGVRHRECERCGKEQSKTISAKGHLAGEWIIDCEPTCAEEGSRRQMCRVCGEIAHEESIPKTDEEHRYELESWKNSDDSSSLHHECAYCSKSYKETDLHSDEDVWIKVSTFNTYHSIDYDLYLEDGEKIAYPERVAEKILSEGIDIIALQEVDVNRYSSTDEHTDDRADQPQFIADYLTEKTGEQYYYRYAVGLVGEGSNENYENQYGYDVGLSLYGIATISKYPIIDCRIRHLAFNEDFDENDYSTYYKSGEYEHRVLLITDILVEGRVITVINTHLDLQQDNRMKSVKVLEEELENINNPVIFLGDMNFVGTSPEMRYVDRFLLEPTASITNSCSTFPSNNPNRTIDWIFVSEDIEFCNHTVSKVDASDHLPVWVMVKIPD